MGRFVLLVAVLAGLGLATAASAFADTPELYTLAYDTALGRSSDTELGVVVPASGPAAASIVFYSPQGYGVTIGQAPGTKVGTVTTAVTLGGSPTEIEADGDLVADDPAKYVGNTCAPGLHAGVLVANLAAAGTTIPVPLYVDPTSGADAALGGFKIQACLASPDVPAAIGGAPAGLRVVEAFVDFTSVFTNPAATGTYTWRVFETPFTPGTATPDPTATVEARSLVGLPKLFSVKWALNAARTRLTLSGKVTEAGKPRAGVNVRFLGGPKSSFDSWTALGVTKTKADGSFSFTRAVTGSLYVYAHVNPYISDSCSVAASMAPGGCVFESTGPSFGPILHVTVPKAKKK
jgi:hypothetical protein